MQQRHARWDRQHTRDNMRLGTCGMQLAKHVPDEMQRGPGDRQRTPRDMGHWGGPQATDHRQRAADPIRLTAMPQTTSKGQRARHHWKMCNRK
jgi:hypothetical protein